MSYCKRVFNKIYNEIYIINNDLYISALRNTAQIGSKLIFSNEELYKYMKGEILPRYEELNKYYIEKHFIILIDDETIRSIYRTRLINQK